MLSFSFISRNAVIRSIAISPVLLMAVLFETSVRNAYTSDSDTIFIPFAGYLVYYFAFSMVVTLELDSKDRYDHFVLLWNPRRNIKSLASLVVSGLIFWYWIIFLAVSINVAAIGSAIICTLMVIVIPIARTIAIQDVTPKTNPCLENPELENTESRIANLDERYEKLRAELDRLKTDEA